MRRDEPLERARVVHRLRHHVLRPRSHLLLEPPDLLLDVRLARIGAAPDVDAERGADQVAGEVAAVVEVVHDPDEPDRVHVVDRGRVRVVAELRRVAGDREDVAQAERVGPEEVRLNAEEVPVAARVVEDRVDPHLLLQEDAEGLRAHPRRGAGPVGDVDRVDLALLAVLRALDQRAGVGAPRGVELDRHHELPAQPAGERRLLLARDRRRRLLRPRRRQDLHLRARRAGTSAPSARGP